MRPFHVPLIVLTLINFVLSMPLALTHSNDAYNLDSAGLPGSNLFAWESNVVYTDSNPVSSLSRQLRTTVKFLLDQSDHFFSLHGTPVVNKRIHSVIRKHSARDGSDGGKSVCVGSSFSPTNCNSPDSQVINVNPTLNVAPKVSVRKDTVANAQSVREMQSVSKRGSGETCVGSSFSPTNCNSPGSQRIDVEPNINVSPTIGLGH